MTEKKLNQLFIIAVLLFFFVWYFLVALTNVCDLLIAGGILPDTMTFRSGNFLMIKRATFIYGGGATLSMILLAIVSLLELLIADCFALACFGLFNKKVRLNFWLQTAFFSGMIFWALMILSAEALIFYKVTEKFMVLFIMHGVAFKLLLDRVKKV